MIMTNIQKVITVAVILVLVGGTYLLARNTKDTPGIFGAIGTNPVENYIPIIKYNEGYYSELPVTTTSDLTAALGSFTSFKLGSTGTTQTRQNTGICYLAVGSSTPLAVAASSTVAVDCQGTNVLASATASYSALAGVTADDNVSISMPTTTPTTNLGLSVQGVGASSTPGYITVKIKNLTGGTFTFATTSAFGWHYFVAK